MIGCMCDRSWVRRNDERKGGVEGGMTGGVCDGGVKARADLDEERVWLKKKGGSEGGNRNDGWAFMFACGFC